MASAVFTLGSGPLALDRVLGTGDPDGTEAAGISG
jgi:hypothetical protein